MPLIPLRRHSCLLLLLAIFLFLVMGGLSPALAQQEKVEQDFEKSGANRNRDSLLPPEEQARKPQFGGILNIRHPYDPPTLNNLVRQDGRAEVICLFLSPRLLRINRDTYALEPFTAAALPEISEDRLVYTWRLRKGLKWDDFEKSGAYVTSRDVKFSFDLFKDPATGAEHLGSDFRSLKEIRVIDDWTFEAVYDEPRVDTIFKMGHDFRIVPAHILEDVPRAEIASHPLGRAPVGYGLFRFHHWKNNEEILLQRNDLNRHLFPEAVRTHLDGIRFRTVPDSTMNMTLFMRGEIDLCGITPDDWEFKSKDPDFQKVATRHLYFLPFWTYIAWNNESIFFNDPRVRRAMTHMVRREEVLKSHIHGNGKLITGPLFYYSDGYDRSIQPFPFDPGEAARLLKEAGWEDHDEDGILDKMINDERVKFEFEFMKGSYRIEYVEALISALREDLRAIGILMNIRESERSVFAKRLDERTYHAFFLAFRTYPLFEDHYGKWHSSQADPGRGNNRACYRNEETDKLLERLGTEFDEEKRIDLLRALHAKIHEDQPFTFLYSIAALVAVNKRWRNVKIHNYGPELYEWWLPEEKQAPSDQVFQ